MCVCVCVCVYVWCMRLCVCGGGGGGGRVGMYKSIHDKTEMEPHACSTTVI